MEGRDNSYEDKLFFLLRAGFEKPLLFLLADILGYKTMDYKLMNIPNANRKSINWKKKIFLKRHI